MSLECDVFSFVGVDVDATGVVFFFALIEATDAVCGVGQLWGENDVRDEDAEGSEGFPTASPVELAGSTVGTFL